MNLVAKINKAIALYQFDDAPKSDKAQKRQAYLDACDREDLLDLLGQASRARHKAEEAMRELRAYHDNMQSFLDRIKERHRNDDDIIQQCDKKPREIIF